MSTETKDKVNSVIAFPVDKIVRTHVNLENLTERKIEFVDFVIGRNMTAVYNQLAFEGFNVESEDFLKDFSYTVEVLKSGLYRSLDMEHPIQKFVDDTVEMFNPLEEDDEEELE
jgi:hypothetical protein